MTPCYSNGVLHKFTAFLSSWTLSKPIRDNSLNPYSPTAGVERMDGENALSIPSSCLASWLERLSIP